MGLARLVTRRSNTSVVLGMAVSLGVVVLASTALGWRRNKKAAEEEQAGVEEQGGPEQEALWAERAGAATEEETDAAPREPDAHTDDGDAHEPEPEPAAASPPREYRFKPPPARDPDAPRWDTPPSTLNDASTG